MNLKNIVEGQKKKIEDLPSLLFKVGDLMKEGYQLSDSINLLLPYYSSHANEYVEKMNQILNDGYGAPEIFELLGVNKEFLVSIYFAEKHGELANTLQLIGNQMKQKNLAKKRLRKALLYPSFMFLMLVMFFIGFRIYFLPNISHLMLTRSEEGQSTIQLSRFLLHIPDYFILIGMTVFLSITIFIVFLLKKDVRSRITILLKIPILKSVYQLAITRQISRNLGNLLLAGFSLQDAFQQLKSQHYNPDIQFIADYFEQMIIQGHSLSSIIRISPYFFQHFELFVEHGEKNGLLGKELVVYCDVLDEKMNQLSETVLKLVQPITLIIIAICIISAYLSILLPMYKMIDLV